MAKETLGLKVDSEIAAKFKEIQAGSGAATAQDFIETLLAAHAKKQEDTDTSSPVYKEQVKVKQALASAERVLFAFLEIASNDKIQAQTQAQASVKAAQAETSQTKELFQAEKAEKEELKADIENLKKEISILKEKAESLTALKEAWAAKETAWAEKEASFNARIGELDAEAKTARELAKKVVILEKQVSEKNHQLSLAELSATGHKEKIQTLENSIEQFKTDYEALKDKNDNLKENLTAEKIICVEKINAERTAAAQIKGELEAVRSQLRNQETLLSDTAKLKHDLDVAIAENQRLSKQVEGPSKKTIPKE